MTEKYVNVNRFVLQALDERHQKYKMMEGNLMARKRRLKSQLPDITSSLTLINKLRAKKDANEETNSQFLLSDSVFASAKIPPTDKVRYEKQTFCGTYFNFVSTLMDVLYAFSSQFCSIFYIGVFMAWCQCYAGVQPGRRRRTTEKE